MLRLSAPSLAALSLLTLLLGACGIDRRIISPLVHPCAPATEGLVSGLTTIDEDFNDGAGDAQFTTDPTCWAPFRSQYEGMDSSNFAMGFTNTTIGGSAQNARQISVTYGTGIETNTTVDYSPHATPDTGWDSGQWPYIVDIYKNPQCYADVTLTTLLKISPAGSPIYGVVLNADITGAGPTRSLTGYLIHLNVGGNSATLVKFDGAYDHGFDYLDHFPGLLANPNPLTDGPYKGWDFFRTAFPAGGSVNGADRTIAARYRYDLSTSTATLEWEVRPADGSDATPGVYDLSRVLTGDDALPPTLGGYGYYTTLYGSLAGPASCAPDGCTNTVSVGNFRLDCQNP